MLLNIPSPLEALVGLFHRDNTEPTPRQWQPVVSQFVEDLARHLPLDDRMRLDLPVYSAPSEPYPSSFLGLRSAVKHRQNAAQDYIKLACLLIRATGQRNTAQELQSRAGNLAPPASVLVAHLALTLAARAERCSLDREPNDSHRIAREHQAVLYLQQAGAEALFIAATTDLSAAPNIHLFEDPQDTTGETLRWTRELLISALIVAEEQHLPLIQETQDEVLETLHRLLHPMQGLASRH
jgi:hypothetical protein